MILFYNILYAIAFVFYLPVLAVKGKLHRGFIQRFGYFGGELAYCFSKKPNIWIHAVSVGEVLAVVGLVEKIREANPQRQIVISTVTQTGFAVAQKRFRKEDIVIYAPLDFGFSVSAYIKKIRPDIFIVAETELWPNLLTGLAAVDVPVVMVNGRISDKSFCRYQRFRPLFFKSIRRFRGFCMQGTKDADRVIALGAIPKNVTVVGSTKFDDIPTADTMTRNDLGLSDKTTIWVAGSTHPGEEAVVLDVFKKIKAKHASLLLILAPRHIERTGEVCALAAQNGFVAQKFSGKKPGSVSGDVIVVDTIGHLKELYRLADVVFVGKSLIGQGGQNIIEPAIFAKPVIVGPHMQNFADIVDIFLADRAIIQISDVSELEDAVFRLISSPQARQSLGERAYSTVQRNQGATERTLKIISQILGATNFFRPT